MNPSSQKIMLPEVTDSWGMLPDIRYDKIFAEMGCHTEYVTEPHEIKPALERSFKSGKTSVLNIIPDCSMMPPQQQGRIDLYRARAADKLQPK
jgi:thiamine pyrophosphate-dependent acetolactate synthase large subunit-like protein